MGKPGIYVYIYIYHHVLSTAFFCNMGGKETKIQVAPNMDRALNSQLCRWPAPCHGLKARATWGELGALCSPWGAMSVSLSSRASRVSGWKQAGQPNLNPRLTIMPDTPLTNGQGFAQMELRMDQLSKKMDAVLEELRSWREKVQSSKFKECL